MTQPNVEVLVAQIEAVNEKVTAVAAACTPAQWQTVVPEEERTVGVVFHHIAFAYPFIGKWASKVANGEALPQLTYDDIHNLNHQHAQGNKAVTQAETVALLGENVTAVCAQIRALQDEQLAKTAPFALIGNQEINAQQVIEWFLLNHANNHLEAIQETLDSA